MVTLNLRSESFARHDPLPTHTAAARVSALNRHVQGVHDSPAPLAAGAPAQLPQHRLTDDDTASFLRQFDQTGFTLDCRAHWQVQFPESAEPAWMSEAEKIHAKMNGSWFLDVTDTPELDADRHLGAFTKNTTFPKPNRTDAVKCVVEMLSTDRPF